MRPICTMEGMTVFSDKPGSVSIQGKRVIFGDGSWCDVSSKEIRLHGPGTVSIDRAESTLPTSHDTATYGIPRRVGCDGSIRIGPTVFGCDALVMTGISAFLLIDPWDRPGIETTIDCLGPEADYFKLRLSSSTLTVSEGSGVAKSPNTKLRLRVPKSTDIVLDQISGGAKIGDLENKLIAKIGGHREYDIGRVQSASISLKDAANVKILEVTEGPVIANIFGSGRIEIENGRASELTVHVTGNGKFYFPGESDTATLSIMGIGEINVGPVKTKPVQNVMGHGVINIGR